MLNIMKMNAVGLDGKTPIMNFEFTFDNSTELPKGPGYQLGQRIYVIEEGSTAINNSTNIIYKYSLGKWIKTPNKSTSTTNTITENGSYNIASNIATGTGNIDVNVIGGGVTLIDKTITENGEYLPADDDANGYSKVVVDVGASINSIRCGSIGRQEQGSSNWTIFGNTVLKKPNNGVLELSDIGQLFSIEAIKQLIFPNSFKYFVNLTFTPSSDFTGFSSAEGLTIHMYGDEITPGDGKCYYAYCSRTENPYTGDYFTVTVKKGSVNFSCVIE